MKAGWTRVLVGAAVVAILVGAGTVITLADTGGVIYACVNNANGGVRIVAQQVSCKPNETSAHWNVIGPQGPAGPQGATGPAGPAGPAGPPGQSGPLQQVVGVVTVHPNAGSDDVTEAITFTTGITAPAVTGGTPGRATVEPATFTKALDKTSPDLFKLIAKDEQITITVDLCNTVNAPPTGIPSCIGTPYAKYVYDHAHLSKIATTTSPMFTQKPEEEVTFVYDTVAITTDGKTVTYDARTGTVS